ncbi:MAG: ATP-binding protein [Planctomycetota bacterium]
MEREELTKNRRQILSLVYKVIATLLIAALLLVGLVSVRFAITEDIHDRVEHYHIVTVTLTGEIADSIGQLRAELGGNSGQIMEGLLPPAIDEIGSHLDSVESLQRLYDLTEYRGCLARTRDRFEVLRSLMSSRAASAEALASALRSLLLSNRQLQLLHVAEMERVQQDLFASSRRLKLYLTGSILIVLLATWRLLSRTLRLLRERLREHAETAEALVQRERELQHSRKLQALGTLVGSVAHDFNNFLSVVLANADALIGSFPEDDPRKSNALEIQQSTVRAAELVRRLLAFSRPEMVEPSDLDLNHIIRECETLLRRLLNVDTRLEIEFDSALEAIRADRVQIEQILLNLVANARDAMPDGGRLRIRTELASVTVGSPTENDPIDPGAYCLLTIEDTGVGIDRELIDKIFEPFFTTKSLDHGTGLGLSTVYGIVTSSNGQVRVESQPGEGSRFRIYFPSLGYRVKSQSGEVVPREAKPASGTLLFVEDQPELRSLTSQALRQAGYTVLDASDPLDAKEIFLEDPGGVDLVVTDVIMPGLSGPRLVSELRRARPDLRVVYTSGYSGDSDQLELSNSSDPYLHKPFHLEALLRVIETQLATKDASVRGKESTNT